MLISQFRLLPSWDSAISVHVYSLPCFFYYQIANSFLLFFAVYIVPCFSSFSPCNWIQLSFASMLLFFVFDNVNMSWFISVSNCNVNCEEPSFCLYNCHAVSLDGVLLSYTTLIMFCWFLGEIISAKLKKSNANSLHSFYIHHILHALRLHDLYNLHK